MSRKRQELYGRLQWSRQNQEGLVLEKHATELGDEHLPPLIRNVASHRAGSPNDILRPSSREGVLLSNLHIPSGANSEQGLRRPSLGQPIRGKSPSKEPHLRKSLPNPTRGSAQSVWDPMRPETASDQTRHSLHESAVTAIPGTGPRAIHALKQHLTALSRQTGQKVSSLDFQPEQIQLSLPSKDELYRKDPLNMTREEQHMTYEQAREEAWSRDGYQSSLARTLRLGAPASPPRDHRYDYPTAAPSSADREEDVFSMRSSQPLNVGAVKAWSEPAESVILGSEVEDSPLSRNRTMAMSVQQKVTQVVLDAQTKVDYIKMQHDYFDDMLKKLRGAPGYRDLTLTPKSALPDLKTALSAVRKRDEAQKLEVARARAFAENEGRRAEAALKAGRLQSVEDEDVDEDDDFEGLGRRNQLEPMSSGSDLRANDLFKKTSFMSAMKTDSMRHSSPFPAPDVDHNHRVTSMKALYIPGQEYSRISSGGSLSPNNSAKQVGMMSRLSAGHGLMRHSTTMTLLAGRRSKPLGSTKKQGSFRAGTLFIPDARIAPDHEDDAALDRVLQGLQDGDVTLMGKENGASTYSQLVKPALNSASAPFTLGDAEEWDPELTLGWSNRGIGDKKMGVLRDTLLSNTHLTGIKLAGNNLGNECVADVLATLSLPEAPHIRQIDFSANTRLNWRCSQAIAAALGFVASGPVEFDPDAPPDTPQLPSNPIEMLRLSRLLLNGVKLGDKGAVIIAKALKTNRILKELDLSRCNISDTGGAALLAALEEGCLVSLNLSWNALRGESAKALKHTLGSNGSLQKIDLGHNGLSDQDASVILMGLTHHGTWRNVDLSYNNLGAGSALVISELTDILGKKAAEFVHVGTYAATWDLEQFPAGCIDTRGWKEPLQGSPKKPAARLPYHDEFGMQLRFGPMLMEVGGNPIGFAGLRQVLHSLDWMSMILEEAVVEMRGGEQLEEKDLPPWPIHIRIGNCNVDITDIPPEGSEVEGMDAASPNPFLPSIMKLMEVEEKEKNKKKGKSTTKKSKKVEVKVVKEYFLTTQSQSLDLTSPAGKYQINLSHPASWLVLRHLMDLLTQLKAANAQGILSDVSVTMKEISINDRPCKMEKLNTAADLEHGLVKFNIQSPSILLASEPAPITDMVVDWMMVTLGDVSCANLWKLSVIAVACSHFYFTWEQALRLIELFDPDMATSERLRASEMLYARCVQPLDFWLEALPNLPPLQAEMLMARMGELAAFDIDNPSGKFMLNLSRGIDRFIAMRLQDVSVLENSWKTCKYFLNWRNAMVNGSKLNLEGLQKLRDYTIPSSGTLRIDYVTYRVPEQGSHPCPQSELKALLSQLRRINQSYGKELLALRREYLPFAQLQSSKDAAAAKAVTQRRKGFSAAKTLNMSVRHLAGRLESLSGSSTDQNNAAAAPPPKPWWQEAGFTSVGTVLLTRYTEATRAREARVAALAAKHKAEMEAQSLSAGYVRSYGRVLSMVPGGRQHSMTLLEEETRPATSPAGLTLKPEDVRPDSKGGAESKSQPSAASRPSSPSRKIKTPAGKGQSKTSPPLQPPQYRTIGASLSPDEELQAQELVASLLSVSGIEDVAKLLCKYSAKHTARALYMLLRLDQINGAKAAAMLLDCMSPISAIRFVFQLFDQVQPILPSEVRQKLLNACQPELVKHLNTLQTEVNGLALKRSRQIRITLQCFASFNDVSSTQVLSILRALKYEQDRCSAMVTLWARIVDRPGIYNNFQALNVEEQRQVLNRLGYWHVWTTIGYPQNLHFYLDLTDPEQKDVARDIVKLGCKASMATKAAAKAQGSTQAAQHLLNLRGNGSLMSIAEDDKMWMMIDNSYRNLEFDFAPVPEQADYKKLMAVTTIQRRWRSLCKARKAMLRYNEEEGSGVTSRPFTPF
ncbi:hypothetical protein CEUSTIGMA_g382.t1 [Chlamydomonas eustigma]|uniref:DUF4476 domain-containing protein n=1 Tax=Chlamydomonas eustigma TaxID=1157962 RepID=A0A250WQ11_9CHLO|nr:hypothetical protein CEUSTIGMA_g382.t1 [Chlamydomonas eustigma]|eukprot:GAX72927.1 hypothetical protein CEUSTIGMA_g382.t1 [Chlamydomonas eustigma]